MNMLQNINSKITAGKIFPDIKPGVTLKVHQKIKEGDKTRTQVFEGIVIARKHGSEPGATITVRKVIGGIGVEKIFPLYLPTIEKFEVVKASKVRRAKLYYLRGKTARETRRKTKFLEVSSQAAATQQANMPPQKEQKDTSKE
jgi:large subunit ribosomal protein L19